jgi:hypothetical protein
MNDSIDSKSELLHSTNNWIDDTDNEVNESRPIILITKIVNIENMIYDLTLLSNQMMDQIKNHNS